MVLSVPRLVTELFRRLLLGFMLAALHNLPNNCSLYLSAWLVGRLCQDGYFNFAGLYLLNFEAIEGMLLQVQLF